MTLSGWLRMTTPGMTMDTKRAGRTSRHRFKYHHGVFLIVLKMMGWKLTVTLIYSNDSICKIIPND
jgi:hypothetical protein